MGSPEERGEIMPNCAMPLRDPTDLLYSSARDRGQRAMLWAGLTGRSRCLLSLEEVRQRSHVSTTERKQLDAETRAVPIAQIVGSEGRCGDFDRDFNPLHDHNRGRWLRIAAARRRGTPLPPVDLVQVGDLYFVQDGHHGGSGAGAAGHRGQSDGLARERAASLANAGKARQLGAQEALGTGDAGWVATSPNLDLRPHTPV
jgi:hypothetical protein